MKDLKAFLLWWNNTFPLDRKYREKYGIAFGSEQHRQVCQIDVLLNHLENEIYEDAMKDAIQHYEKEENLKNGILINKRETVTTEQEQEIIANLSINSFKNIKLE